MPGNGRGLGRAIRKRKQATKCSTANVTRLSTYAQTKKKETGVASHLAARHVSVISEIRRWREGDEPGLQREALEEEGRQRRKRREQDDKENEIEEEEGGRAKKMRKRRRLRQGEGREGQGE